MAEEKLLNESRSQKTLLKQASLLEQLMIDRATGNLDASDEIYQQLRRVFLENVDTRTLTPSFVRTARSLDVFWSYIKAEAGTYAERRRLISEAFSPLIEYLERWSAAPSDVVVSSVLEKFDSETVLLIWQKALSRKDSDPEGAITVARTLLETVCKKILDHVPSQEYSEKDDLPKLYGKTAKALKLAPDQHSEEPIKAILGGAIQVVNGLGTLRNKLSDAHGRGGNPVKPATRHAALVVNLAGGLACFLVETFKTKGVT